MTCCSPGSSSCPPAILKAEMSLGTRLCLSKSPFRYYFPVTLVLVYSLSLDMSGIERGYENYKISKYLLWSSKICKNWRHFENSQRYENMWSNRGLDENSEFYGGKKPEKSLPAKFRKPITKMHQNREICSWSEKSQNLLLRSILDKVETLTSSIRSRLVPSRYLSG